METGPPLTKVQAESSLHAESYDGLVLVTWPGQTLKTSHLATALETAKTIDRSFEAEIAILPLSTVPAGRLVHSPTGPIDPDYDDVRVLKNAAAKGVKRALKAGIKKPLLVLEENAKFENSELVTLLGALEALYVPIQLRELDPSQKNPVEYLGVYSPNQDKLKQIIELAVTLESGRRVACDIGDADPERMCPPRIEEYIYGNFKNSNIKISTVKEQANFEKDFPLLAAVNRAASHIQRHQGRIVFLEYNPANRSDVKKTLFLVGKGVTYDTGGIDVKINGAMTGMSRDKCGAAATVGFMEVVRMLQPKDVRVVAGVGLVRNSIGSNGYVSDELITARSGRRVRIGNTDAEGRLVMADILCKLKDEALNAVNPHLFTIATLTGHAFLTVGEGYSIVLDNGPAFKASNCNSLQKAGDLIGDIFEISRIRSDDFVFCKGEGTGDDIRQCNTAPSSRTPRGHQGPAAFLIRASGLDLHGSGSQKPLKYSHLDIAASAGEYPKPATGSPVLALAQAYLLNK